MYLAFVISALLVGSFLVGFYLISPFFPMEKHEKINNQSMTDNQPRKDWGDNDRYCMVTIKFKDNTKMQTPWCEL